MNFTAESASDASAQIGALVAVVDTLASAGLIGSGAGAALSAKLDQATNQASSQPEGKRRP